MPEPAAVLRRVGRASRQVGAALRSQVRQTTRRLPLREDLVLYEAFAGRGMLCHPEAVFRELFAAPDLAHLRHVWVLDGGDHTALRRAWRGEPRVRFVRRDSLPYARLVATAGYLVNNATFPAYVAKRPGQVYLNTWHGTPLKRMGYDEPGGAFAARNTVRNFLMCDWLLSASPEMTRQTYAGGYRLTNVFRGRVLETGNPRTDVMFAADAAAGARRLLRENGVVVDPDERVVLFAPPWRGDSFTDPDDPTADLVAQVRGLREHLPEGHRVLLKVHQQVQDLVVRDGRLREVLVPGHLPTNRVLCAADVLVTDFSSIFFDALPLGLPVVFLAPDLEEYRDTRGLYLPVEQLPGPVTTQVADAAALVAAVGGGSPRDPQVSHREQYRAAVARYAPRDDGHAAARLVDVVFRGRTDLAGVRELAPDGRSTLLVHLGALKPNGITASAVNLLRHLDHTRFDVTAMYDDTGDAPGVAAELVPDEVRCLVRIAGLAGGPAAAVRRRMLFERAATLRPDRLEVVRRPLESEWYRCVGDARFEYVVEFGGYSPTWTYLLAAAECRSRSIWLHNDLRADQLRESEGRQPFRDHLAAVFAGYRHYDHLVSVSPSLEQINAANLAQYAPREKFGFARNTIDPDRILAAAGANTAGRDPGVFTFVAVGRVSREKNHERLVRAFAAVHGGHPHARLVVIGDGPLLGRTRDLTRELGLDEAVTFTGVLADPWAVMATCDAFVLSSDYEGQPMVILEALVLGLPVVTTAFGSVRSALPEGTGLVVERSVEALAEGMQAALAGAVPHPPFDAKAYNEAAMAEFYTAIGAGPAPG